MLHCQAVVRITSNGRVFVKLAIVTAITRKTRVKSGPVSLLLLIKTKMVYQAFEKEEWHNVSEKLRQQLGPEFLAQRPGPSGRPLTYIEGKTAINIANDIFGFNGWSTDIKDTTVDFVRLDETGK